MYYIFILGKIIAVILSRRYAYGLAKVIAYLRYYFDRKDREAILYNLTPFMPDRVQREACARKVFINFAYYLVDFFRYGRLDKSFIKKYVRVSGLEHLDILRAEKLPAIAVTAHLGNYELAGAVTSLLGYPVAAVALPHRDKRTNHFFNMHRERVGIKVVATGNAIKGCISALKQGYLLALLADRDFSGHGLKMSFFSQQAFLPRGAAFFAKKTGACIIPGFLIREKKYFYHLKFEAPFFFDADMDEVDIIKRYIPVLEKYIKEYPEQWYLFEKYWLTEGVASREEAVL